MYFDCHVFFTSPALTSVRPRTGSYTTSLSHIRDTGLMNELFDGQEIGSMTTSKELESMAQLPAPGSRQFPVSEGWGDDWEKQCQEDLEDSGDQKKKKI